MFVDALKKYNMKQKQWYNFVKGGRILIIYRQYDFLFGTREE